MSYVFECSFTLDLIRKECCSVNLFIDIFKNVRVTIRDIFI